MTFHIINDQTCSSSFVEFVWPALLQTREGRGEIRLHEQITFLVELAVVEIDALGLGIFREVFMILKCDFIPASYLATKVQRARERIGYRKAIRRQSPGGFDQLRPGQTMRSVSLKS